MKIRYLLAILGITLTSGCITTSTSPSAVIAEARIIANYGCTIIYSTGFSYSPLTANEADIQIQEVMDSKQGWRKARFYFHTVGTVYYNREGEIRCGKAPYWAYPIWKEAEWTNEATEPMFEDAYAPFFKLPKVKKFRPEITKPKSPQTPSS